MKRMMVLSALVVALAGCGGVRPMTVRVSPVHQLGGQRHLEGVRVALRSVRDKRPEQDTIGRHSESLWWLRFTIYEYVARESVESTVEAALHHALEGAGATVVDASAAADVVLDVDVTALDVTCNIGGIGQESTWGVVGIDARVAEGERVLGHASVRWPFAVEYVQDPGAVGDALQRAASVVVGKIPKPTKPTTST
jgi:hypothetical protein